MNLVLKLWSTRDRTPVLSWTGTALLVVAALLCGCQSPGAEVQRNHDVKAAMANPASVNCLEKGGRLIIQKRGDGGEYGICVFEDDRRCEEWALFRRECPPGGKKITGLVTPAAQYCVITGGSYIVTGAANTPTEQGSCLLKDGRSCDVWDHYEGKCPR